MDSVGRLPRAFSKERQRLIRSTCLSSTPLVRAVDVAPRQNERLIPKSSYVSKSDGTRPGEASLTVCNLSIRAISKVLGQSMFPCSSLKAGPLTLPKVSFVCTRRWIHFFTGRPNEVVDASGVKWYQSPVSPLNRPRSGTITQSWATSLDLRYFRKP